MGKEDEALESFLKWAADMGVSDSKYPPQSSVSQSQSCLGQSLVVSYFPNAGGRGLAAARELKKGELILTVPKGALLTSSRLLEDGRAVLSLKRYPRLSSTQMLVLALLAEVGKGRCSQWAPYLAQLPHTYCTLSCFTQFDIQALQVEEPTWAAEMAVLKAQSDWKQAVSFMQEIGLARHLRSFRSWLWATEIISSRTLYIPWDEAGCLCPVGDLFNYMASEELCSTVEISPLPVSAADGQSPFKLMDGGYSEDLAAYCFFARKNYEKGEQVLVCYGVYTNLELLEHYGFLLDDNPNDKAFIQLDPEIQFLSSWPQDALYIQHDGKPSFALKCALRLWASPHRSRKDFRRRAYSGSILSVENEIKVSNWLVKHCGKLLDNLPTTVEDDGALLQALEQRKEDPCMSCGTGSMDCNPICQEFLQGHGFLGCSCLHARAEGSQEKWKLAVRWRLSYKRSLSKCVLYCIERISLFSSQNIKCLNYDENLS